MNDSFTPIPADARVVELSHDLAMGMPVHSSHPPYLSLPFYRHGDLQLPGGYWGTNEVILMSGHAGTHIDGLGHASREGRLFGGIDAQGVQRGPQGLTRYGAETIPPVFRRGVLIDVARSQGTDVLEPGHRINADQLRRAGNGVEVRQGDCVLVRTGQARLWDDKTKYLGEANGCPGIDVEAAEWLAQCGAFLIGSDTAAVEWQSIDPDRVGHYPVHLSLLVDHGIYLVENLDLEELSATRATEFLFVCLALKLRGSSASPVRAVAVLS